MMPNASHLRQYLLFGQGGSFFAVELFGVREVLMLSEQPVSPVPNTQPFLLGLTNLRGEILAVGDFGRLIGDAPADTENPRSRILILEVPVGGAAPQERRQEGRLEVMRVGLAVTHVEGVVALNRDQIVSAIEVSEDLAPFLKGLYDFDGRLLMILDAERIGQSPYW
ncbi:chemotaxis protein CheW [Kamptonema formosum]|uniref:chemotaxis protein CheW n=1 Tax=Kamptonema formosum TaxID=331992 RepID=UPI00037CA6D0|nr:chemotaxis protein CheW [Oscillatoria sp. PCC 10802]